MSLLRRLTSLGIEWGELTLEAPLDEPVEPVTEWPLESDGIEFPTEEVTDIWEAHARRGRAIMHLDGPQDAA